MTYIVIENTPGYLPEDDDPATFEDYAEAVAYLNERAELYEQDGFTVEYGWASADNYAACFVSDKSKTHDLGRVIEIVQAFDED